MTHAFGFQFAGSRFTPLTRFTAVALLASGLGAAQLRAQCGSSAQSVEAQPRMVQASHQASKSSKTILDTAKAAGQFKTLAAAIDAAGLTDALNGDGPFTVFAPTDEAFAKLPKETLEMLLKPENKEKLASILKYHVVSGSVKAEDVVELDFATTLNGQRVDVTASDAGVQLDSKTKVVTTDIVASNGVIHVIDSVLMPKTANAIETAKQAGSFTTLLAAIDAAGLTQALSGPGPFTILAPTDEAFAKLPADAVKNLLKPENKETLASILKLHVIPTRAFASDVTKLTTSPATLQGQTLKIESDKAGVRIGNTKATAKVTTTDIQASNAVIHVIDTVLMPK